MSDKYIGTAAAAKILGVQVYTLKDWDRFGKFKAYRHPVTNRRLYSEEEIKNLAERIRNPEKPK